LKRKRYESRYKGIDFNLDITDFPRPLPKTCPVTQATLVYSTHIYRHPDRSVVASLDRVFPNLGYIKGNVQIISQRANSLKSNMDADEMMRLVDYIHKNSPY
jgi:hypothetical protein